MGNEITHTGIITRIDSDKILVSIISQSACSACHAKGSCLASEMEEKEIEIHDYKGHYTVGQRVTVLMKGSAGTRAILYGYLMPFVVLMVSLFVAIPLTGSEITGGLIAIAMLVPYYAGLFIFRKRLQKSFRFELEAT